MCGDSLSKIETSSLLSVPKGKIEPLTDPKHAETLIKCFAEFYDQGKYTDIVLSGYDHMKYQAHSVILAASSEFLSNLFSNVESDYHLDFVESDTLGEVIRFCYTGEINLSSDNIQSVLYAVHDLGIHRLKTVCNQFLESATDTEHLLQYAIIAEKCGLNSAKDLAKKFVLNSCNKIYEANELRHLNANYLNDAVVNLCSNQTEIFANLIQSLDFNGIESRSLLMNSYQAIYQLFFIAGYIQSMRDMPDVTLPLEKSPALIRSNTVDIIPNALTETNDEGLFMVAKSRLEGVEVYALSESQRMFRITPKYHINIDKTHIDTLKIFPNREKIYLSYVKEQKLIIKSWSFKRQTIIDTFLPGTVQMVKPRLTNAVGETFFVAEEKYVTWPYEGYKTVACRFGLEKENYKSIDTSCGGIKELIGIRDEIFVFNQKAEVFSFTMSTGKRFPKGTLSHNGILKAVIYHGNVYVGCYVRSKCTLFVFKFNENNNEWALIRSICSYTDASNYHIGATENFLYIFCGKGKVQRYNDISDHWLTFGLPENFNQNVFCVSTSPFTCVMNKF